MRKLSLLELDRLDTDTFRSSKKLDIVVVLDNVRSALNVGSFFRTSDCLGLSRLILTGISATPPHKEITKSAIGATSSMDWEYIEDVAEAVQQLKMDDYFIIGIEQTTESIELSEFELDANKSYALVFGNEVNGISDEVLPHLDAAIEIAQFGTKHSFNVAVCGGIVLWNFSSKLRAR